MANEIHWDTAVSLNLYFCAFQLDGDVFLTGGASDETWGTGGRTAADYDEAITETAAGESGHYVGSFAASPAAGRYKIAIYQRAGANPANTDMRIARGEIRWDGSAEILPADEEDITTAHTTTDALIIAQVAAQLTVYDEREG